MGRQLVSVGAIRDPLSGRSYVYQAMRISVLVILQHQSPETRAAKSRCNRIISKTAAHGYSSYGEPDYLGTNYVREYFHPGFAAKRMELGAVVGAVPKGNVVRENRKGDAIILPGGKTGRDGVGGATGSSKVQTVESVETAGAEVQKGMLSKNAKFNAFSVMAMSLRLIKKSNDFGAGGVCGYR